ncbi:maltotransferase domain-containing protein, partial [Streptomyces sp. NPDC048566]|uniref:maltotransferase domain-containing protein n=1 Tax=Streptomyces sp. NPDC048566 TaxID=3365569 RepID=UPI0037194D82
MPATHHSSPPPTATSETPRKRRTGPRPRTEDRTAAPEGAGSAALDATPAAAPDPVVPDPVLPDPAVPDTAAPSKGGSRRTAASAPGAAPRKKARSAVPATRSGGAGAAPRAAATAVGRIPVLDVRPVVLGGSRPAKAVVGEEFEVSATVFREGHDAVAANVVLYDPKGRPGPWAPMRELAPGTDRWGAPVSADREGRWTYTVEAWSDPVTTWRHHARIKIPAGQDTELVLEEGARLYERAAAGLPKGTKGKRHRDTVRAAVDALRDPDRPVAARLAAALTPEVDEVLARHPLRDLVTASEPLPLLVERERALYGSWYEFFPRSESGQLDPPVHGTFRTAAERLPAIAEMGFDVVYLPPIHPIGTTFR